MQTATKSIMSRNVTEFKHLLSNSYITEHDLQWTIGLRNYHPLKQHRKDLAVPEVFFKQTEASKNRLSENKSNLQTINAGEYEHMLVKKNGKNGSKHTSSQLNFYARLGNKDRKGVEKEFEGIPFKDRNEMPQFLKKNAIKKMNIAPDDQESAFDGSHNQQPYTQNILQNKNYAYLESFTKANPRSRVSLPSLAWQVGLRNYR